MAGQGWGWGRLELDNSSPPIHSDLLNSSITYRLIPSIDLYRGLFNFISYFLQCCAERYVNLTLQAGGLRAIWSLDLEIWLLDLEIWLLDLEI